MFVFLPIFFEIVLRWLTQIFIYDKSITWTDINLTLGLHGTSWEDNE